MFYIRVTNIFEIFSEDINFNIKEYGKRITITDAALYINYQYHISASLITIWTAIKKKTRAYTSAHYSLMDTMITIAPHDSWLLYLIIHNAIWWCGNGVLISCFNSLPIMCKFVLETQTLVFPFYKHLNTDTFIPIHWYAEYLAKFAT